MKKKLKHLLRPEIAFTLLALIFGAYFSYTTPPLWGADETSHIARVYEIIQGNIKPNREDGRTGASIPTNLYNLGNYSIGDLVDNDTATSIDRHDVDNEEAYSRYAKERFTKTTKVWPVSATYSPLSYPGSIAGFAISDSFNMPLGNVLLAARIGSLIVYVSVVAFAIWLLRKSKLKWLVFSIALLPTALYQASVVSADSMAVSLSLLFVAMFIRIQQQDKLGDARKMLAGLLLVGALLPLVKVNYIFISMGLLLIPTKVISKSSKVAAAFKACSFIFILLLTYLWTKLAMAAGSQAVTQRPDGLKTVAGDQITFIVHHPIAFIEVIIRSLFVNADTYFQTTVSIMGWNYVTVPIIFSFSLCFVILIAAMYAKSEILNMRKVFAAWSLLIVACVASIFAALYIYFTPTARSVVEGVQGRYFLPLLMPLVITLVAFLPFDIKVKEKVVPLLLIVACGVCLFASAIYYHSATY